MEKCMDNKNTSIFISKKYYSLIRFHLNMIDIIIVSYGTL